MIMWVMDRQPYDQIKTSENTTRDSRHSICERVHYKFKQMYTYSTTGIYGSWLSIFALTKLRANCVIPKFCYKIKFDHTSILKQFRKHSTCIFFMRSKRRWDSPLFMYAAFYVYFAWKKIQVDEGIHDSSTGWQFGHCQYHHYVIQGSCVYATLLIMVDYITIAMIISQRLWSLS